VGQDERTGVELLEAGKDEAGQAHQKPYTELTIRELEMLLEEKRLALGEKRLRRIAEAEETASGRHEKTAASGQRPVIAPGTPWLSDDELREHFGPWGLEPLASESEDGFLSSRPRRGSWRDRVLLGIEVVALLALALVLYSSFSTLRGLDRGMTQAQETPEPTNTPVPVATLPGRSVSPRESHLPPFYQGIVRPVNPVPLLTPTLGPQAAIRIVIDKIGVDAPVVEGDDWESLKKGVGHHIGSANPGQRGNMVASAHNDVFGETFRDLGKLEPGDEVLVFTQQRSYRYVVREVRIVEPTEMSVMQAMDEPILTLITCYPYMVDTHRVVVTAELAP